MIVEEIRTLLSREPFHPFVVLTSDGREMNIHHHDYAWLTPGGFTLYVADADGRRVHHLSTAQITRVTSTETAEPITPGEPRLRG